MMIPETSHGVLTVNPAPSLSGRYRSDECGPSSERSPGETAISGNDADRLRQLLVHLELVV